MTKVESLPIQLKNDALFCVWRYEERDGKKTKVPYNPKSGYQAKSNNPDTFAPLSIAESVISRYDGLGIGIFGDICAIDIDHCVSDIGFTEMCGEIVATMNTYTEFSPSGKGIRILFKAPGLTFDKEKYYINKQDVGLEVYVAGATNKYVTVTGNTLNISDVLEDRGVELQMVLDKFMLRQKNRVQSDHKTNTSFQPKPIDLEDFELIAKIRRSTSASKFNALWQGDISEYRNIKTGDPDQSAADLALCNILAFWTARDEWRMDSLFRQSGLMRDKWDSARPGGTYGSNTISEAIAACKVVYDPTAHFKKKSNSITNGGIVETRILFDLHPESNERYKWTDIGNGNLFSDWYKELARYVPERKKWFVYDGCVWKPDLENQKAMQLCKKLADDLMIYALSIEDEGKKRDYMDHVGKWQKRAYRETVLKDAASVFPISITEFDGNPFIFNCLNGTLDLRTGAFRDHNPADKLSKVSGVKYDYTKRCVRWERFVDEVMQGDKDKATFLQKALGYALTGDTRHECFFVLYGPTSRNGKGTTMETFMSLMGDYGKSARPDTIAQKQAPNGNGPSEDIARLAGARFVNISEPEKKLSLSAALVKTLTGNDTITARILHENSFEFKPQFKLFINTNHLPSVTDVTLFGSGRVKIIPFERHFAEIEQDKGLKGELAKPESMSGVLNWCLDGLRLIGETGFDVPESVREATEEYRDSCDKIGRFLSDEMVKDVTAKTSTNDAYARYRQWCSRNGHFSETQTNFKKSLENIATISRGWVTHGGTKSQATLINGYRLNLGFEEVAEPSPWG